MRSATTRTCTRSISDAEASRDRADPSSDAAWRDRCIAAPDRRRTARRLRQGAGARRRVVLDRPRSRVHRRSQRHGQVDAVQHAHGPRHPERRHDPLRRRRPRRDATRTDRPARHRLRAPGPTAVPVADGRRAPADARPQDTAANGGPPRPSTTCSRASPSGDATAAPSCRAASSRCSRSRARCC